MGLRKICSVMVEKMRVTIKDIASDTGLSLATISKFINNKTVSAENSAIISESIDRLHYIQNHSAKLLRSSHSKTICMITGSISDVFWAYLFDELSIQFQKEGYSFLLISIRNKNDKAEALGLLSREYPDGILILCDGEEASEFTPDSFRPGVPVIFLDNGIPSCPLVTSSGYISTYEGTEYLKRNGHTDICFLVSTCALETLKDRLRGCLDACKDNGITVKPEHLIQSDTHDLDYSMLRGILNAPTRPTAVFSLSYVSSISLLRFFNQNHNLSKQFSLLFFDDSPLFRTISPAITVISQDMNAMAQTCVKEMIKRIENPEIKDQVTFYVPTKFEKRKSVSPVNK